MNPEVSLFEFSKDRVFEFHGIRATLQGLIELCPVKDDAARMTPEAIDQFVVKIYDLSNEMLPEQYTYLRESSDDTTQGVIQEAEGDNKKAAESEVSSFDTRGEKTLNTGVSGVEERQDISDNDSRKILEGVADTPHRRQLAQIVEQQDRLYRLRNEHHIHASDSEEAKPEVVLPVVPTELSEGAPLKVQVQERHDAIFEAKPAVKAAVSEGQHAIQKGEHGDVLTDEPRGEPLPIPEELPTIELGWVPNNTEIDEEPLEEGFAPEAITAIKDARENAPEDIPLYTRLLERLEPAFDTLENDMLDTQIDEMFAAEYEVVAEASDDLQGREDGAGQASAPMMEVLSIALKSEKHPEQKERITEAYEKMSEHLEAAVTLLFDETTSEEEVAEARQLLEDSLQEFLELLEKPSGKKIVKRLAEKLILERAHFAVFYELKQPVDGGMKERKYFKDDLLWLGTSYIKSYVVRLLGMRAIRAAA